MADFPETGDWPEIAVAGRSNVGKSSLINRLVNRRRIAKVSNTPGRTQLLNFFSIDERFVLCDLPGYGYANVPAAIRGGWREMIERYLSRRETLRGLLLLMDVRRTPGDWEASMVGWCTFHGQTVIPVVTKIDKLPRSRRTLAIRGIAQKLGMSERQLVAWSATTGDGLDGLWTAIDRVVEAGTNRGSAETPEA